MIEIEYQVGNERLTADCFLDLVNKIWPGEYDKERTGESIKKTLNISAWQKGELLGCVRILTDGYFFSTITEILVAPKFQKKGVGRKLMEMAYEESPNTLAFGVQLGREGFFQKLGYVKGLDTYQKKKNRN